MTELTFQYRAIDERGAVTKGVVRAADRTEAYHQIVGTGLKPVHLASARASSVRRRGSSASAKDLARITYQFSVLMEAGIPIADSLLSIADQEPNRRLALVIGEVARQIEAGNSITDALSAHRAFFGDIYIETIRAAETSGNMIQVLARLSEMLDQR
ncbi:MAG: type II secretion system F family protein, partial [Phycisphaerales bacterium]